MLCRLCNTSAPLIRAHTIPRCFFEAVRGQATHAVFIKTGSRKHTTTSQSGVFDKDMLCSACDRMLGKDDGYAHSIIGHPPPDTALRYDRDGAPVAYDLGAITADRVIRFLISVLWRAHWSKHYFFSHVRLGPYEERIRQVLLGGGEAPQTSAQCILIRYFDGPYDGCVYPPWAFRFDGGLRIYRLYLPHYLALINLSDRRFPMPFARMIISDSNSIAVRMSFKNSPDARYLSELRAELRKIKTST